MSICDGVALVNAERDREQAEQEPGVGRGDHAQDGQSLPEPTARQSSCKTA